MKENTILRGCVFNEDVEFDEKKHTEERIAQKIDEIATDTKNAMYQLLEVFTSTMASKIENIENYKLELQQQYEQKINTLLNEVENERQNIIEINKNKAKENEQIINNEILKLRDDIKEMICILFEKFFYKEYKDISNLESLIVHELSKLEDRNKIKISINKALLDTPEELEILLADIEKTKKNPPVALHTSDTLFVEIKNEKETIEYDFKKQMDKIKETVLNFK